MESLSLLAIFIKGGIVMYPLMLCSIIVVAIAIERFSFYRKARVDLEILFGKIKPMLAQKDYTAAAKICEQQNKLVAEVIAQTLYNASGGRDKVTAVFEGTAALMASRLKEKLNYLDVIVTLSPLLGLLGTVVGMIQTFNVMNVKTGQPMAITGGVGEALIATATGLCVAVLALIVHTYYSHYLDVIVNDMEQAGTMLLTEVD